MKGGIDAIKLKVGFPDLRPLKAIVGGKHSKKHKTIHPASHRSLS